MIGHSAGALKRMPPLPGFKPWASHFHGGRAISSKIHDSTPNPFLEHVTKFLAGQMHV